MQVNMLEAKNQLSRLVKAALAGEEVVIASDGRPQVRLVPCTVPPGLSLAGAWAGRSIDLDAAFGEEADEQARRLFSLPDDASGTTRAQPEPPEFPGSPGATGASS